MTGSAQSFPYCVEIEVLFRDLDAMGHVNNAVYLSYLETARIKFLVDLLGLRDLSELPVILAEATISYKSPALFGERLTIGCGISRFGGKSFDMIHRIEAGDGRLVALSRTVLVMYDYATAATIAVPEDLKQRVRALQGGWQAP
ncbi:MAG: acyl-CoA thioesterase [Kouleothrix sp.]|nr:acyl-CoA thioesterase [Kouleothrix sp.]